MSQNREGEQIFESSVSGTDEAGTDKLESFKTSHTAKLDLSRSKDAIVKDSIDSVSSFEYFQGKLYTDNRSHYTYADAIERRIESPVERFVRLRSELVELKADLDELAATERSADASMWLELQSQAKAMIDSAEELAPHRGFNVYETLSSTAASNLDAMAAKLGSISLDQSPSKLYTKTAPSSLQDINVFVQLEKRVAAMESLLGPSTNTISKDTSSTTSLVNTIELLEQKVSTMDTSALDALRAKASSLKADLDNMNKGLPGTKATKGKVSGGADAMGASEIRLLDAAAQLVEVREGLASVQPVADDLPSVIQRLKTLNMVHLSAAGAAQRLSAIESSAATLKASLDDNAQVLSALKEGLAENMSTIKKNFESMDERLGKLKSK